MRTMTTIAGLLLYCACSSNPVATPDRGADAGRSDLKVDQRLPDRARPDQMLPDRGVDKALTTGQLVGGYIWYLGGDGQSCVDVCATRGGVTDGTIAFAGSGGTLANCSAVAVAFGKPAAKDQATGASTYGYEHMGCMYAIFYNTVTRLYDQVTNHTDKYGGDARFCSCKQ